MSCAGVCANCGAALQGPWCSQCGQRDRDLHRSVWRMTLEWLQGVVNFDNQVWRTLPALAVRPAALTREFLAGRRASQAPPLRMFLVVLVVVFFAGAVAERGGPGARPGAPGYEGLTPTQQSEARATIARLDVRLGGRSYPQATRWLQGRVERVVADPDAFSALLAKWAQRLAFVMLPIATGLLALLFLRRRELMLFDHLIFALHSLSFQGLLLSAAMLANAAVGSVGSWLLAAGPVHLFAHLRGVYRTSTAGTLLRVAALYAGSMLAFALVLAAILFAGLVEIGST